MVGAESFTGKAVIQETFGRARAGGGSGNENEIVSHGGNLPFCPPWDTYSVSLFGIFVKD